MSRCIACEWQGRPGGTVGDLLDHRDATGHAVFAGPTGGTYDISGIERGRLVAVESDEA